MIEEIISASDQDSNSIEIFLSWSITLTAAGSLMMQAPEPAAGVRTASGKAEKKSEIQNNRPE